MQTTTTLPAPELMGKLIAGMVGQTVTVDKVPASALDLTKPGTVAAYIRDSGLIAAACVCDVAMTAHMGAALALIPRNQAIEAIETSVIPEHLLENHYEVVNVAARVFNRPNRPHVRLRDVVVLPEMLPGDVSGLIARPTERLEMEIEIEGYGAGVMRVFC